MGDYATILSERIGTLAPASTENILIACGHQRQATLSARDGINLTGVCDAKKLADKVVGLAPRGLVLNYVGYGYAPRGAPLWLLRAVEQIRQRAAEIRLLVMFHELYAVGLPWQSAFWLSPIQRHVARHLVELSDSWITNREGSAEWLRRYAANKPHTVLPVFSNVGEQAIYSSKREAKIVVFGGGGLRRLTYRTAGNALFSWAQAQNLSIHDIGPPIDDEQLMRRLKHMNVCFHGLLAASEVSAQLADAMFGVVTYPVDFVAKSGVYAAYCSHGICPILISDKYVSADRLVANRHYVAGMPATIFRSDFYATVAATGWAWYQEHSVNAHGEFMQSLLNLPPPGINYAR